MQFLLLLPLCTVSLAALDCFPDGPVLPKPKLISLKSSQILTDAAEHLTTNLEQALDGSIEAGWDAKNASFSLALVSADQDNAGVPLWEYHHRASRNTEGTEKVDRHSQYLIGSVSKLISDYVLLQTGIDIDKPITEFLPELGHEPSLIAWKDITMRMLGEHLAGVPNNYGFSEYYFLKDVFVSLGFPPISNSSYPPCGVSGLNGACTKQQYFQGMRDSYPTTATNGRPAYSNVAFTLIFWALEQVSGKAFSELLEQHFSGPLELQETFAAPGDDRKAVIPPGESSWGGGYGYNTPAGGLVSSLSDLTKFAHAILSRRGPMSETDVRGWLKPSSFAGGAQSFVGLPWEIYRPTNLTSDHPHPVTIYAKSGGAVGYRAQWSLVDEYGIGIIVLVAGPPEAMPILHGAMMETFVPAVDKISRIESKESYARKFTSHQGMSGRNAESAPIEAIFEQDEDSLLLKNLTRGDHDISAALIEIFRVTIGSYGFPVALPLRMFPSALVDNATLSDGTRVTREVWKIWPNLETESRSGLLGANYEKGNCVAWTFGDWLHYGGEPMDRVLFYRDERGGVIGFEAPFLRSGVLFAEKR